MNITNILDSKFECINGIYFSSNKEDLSYPEEGNNFYYKLEDESYWFDHRNKIIMLLVDAFFKKKAFLDVGGGNGYNSLHLQHKIDNVYLLEPGFQGCFNAKERGVKTIVCSTLSELIEESVTLESVGLFDVLEHIEDDNQFLRDIYKVLDHDGCFIMTVPAFNFLWSKEDKEAGHFRRYTEKDLIKKVKKAGFQIEYSTYFFSILTLPIFFLRSLPSLLFNRSQDSHSTKNQHQLPNNFLGKIFRYYLDKEILDVKRFRKKSFGSSLIIVAKKY
jgi:SAM-dependent methyltransferase